MKKIFYILTLLLSTTTFAQYTITMDALILDKDTKEAIPYVNVEFLNTDINAVTDAEGKLKLIYEENLVNEKGKVRFTAPNHKTITADISQLVRLLNNTNKIYLTSKSNTKVATTKLRGAIMSKGKPVRNAFVAKKFTLEEAVTDTDGTFEINAGVGDVLIVNHLGMLDYQHVVKDEERITIELDPDTQLLNEVIVEGENKKGEQFFADTGFGKKDLSRYKASNVITHKDIEPFQTRLSDIFRGRMAGVTIGGFVQDELRPSSAARFSQGVNVGRSIIIRGRRAKVFLDGGQYNGDIDALDIDNIDNILVLKTMHETALYGGFPTVLITSKGRYGVKGSNGRYVDSALVTGNDYKEEVALLEDAEAVPQYIVDLENATSYEDALTIYESQLKNKRKKNIPYYMDVAQYFTKWSKAKSVEVLLNIKEEGFNNAKALKALAYKLEELNELEEAKLVYQRIAMLMPNAAQSYRDLALIYKHTGNYRQALDLYRKMLNNSIEGVDFYGLRKPILSEVKHLLLVNRLDVDYSKIPYTLLQASFKYDTRIVFEWNDTDTEFEVQFVDPKKKTFSWEHSMFKNRDRMLDEASTGYHTEEFIIDEAKDFGEWIINVKCLTEETPLNPTYLKYTVFENYGLPNETQTVKVVKLFNKQEKVTLDKIVYTK